MKKNYQFLIVLWVILLSGSVLFMHYYSIVFYLFILMLFGYLLKIKINKSKKSYGILIYFFLIILLGIIYNRDFIATLSYLHLFLKFVLITTIPLIITLKDYIDSYLRIMYILSIASLIIFVCVLFNRDLIILFPRINAFGETYYYNMFFSVFHYPLQNKIANSSVFWEPGAYQAFLNIAIAFELHYNKLKHKKRFTIFLLAILSTFSTTGYIISLILILSFIYLDKSYNLSKHNVLYKILIILCIILFILSETFTNTVIDKFSANNYSYYVRSGSSLIDLIIFSSSPIFGVGQSDYIELLDKLALSMYGLNMGASPNSITSSLALYGGFFVLALLIYYYRFTRLITGTDTKKRIIMFIVFVMLFSTQNFLTSYFFLSLLFYGITNTRLVNKFM